MNGIILSEIKLPKPVIRVKPFQPSKEEEGLSAGLHPVLARVIAARPLPSEVPILEAISPRLKNLFAPLNMQDMDRASDRLAQAILQGEIIGIETDHDCDGQTSHAVLYSTLVHHFNHPEDKIRSYIGHRLTEGYGLSEPVATRILEDVKRPSLLITADNGSSDEPRIQRLKEVNIDVIVTDHHEIPKEGIPMSAYAVLNPTRPDCGYGDPFIAGCMVAWLLMAATRQKLILNNHLKSNAPSLSNCLDFVAVGTIADCVSIARSINNRAVVAYGLRLIEAGTRPCWRVIMANIAGRLSSEDLGFKIGPLLNSDGRLSTAFGSVSFLLAKTDEEAKSGLLALQNSNTERKAIQQDIVLKGLSLAKEQVDKGRYALCIYLKAGHTGVHGIAASRIKDIFGRPTAFFAPKVGAAGIISGSVRGIEGFHVRDALQAVADQHPEILLGFGGHKGAGGLTLQESAFETFSLAFETACRAQMQFTQLGPIIWTDGFLPVKQLNLEMLDALERLEPFGREFEVPVFELKAKVKEIRAMGDGTHARVQLESEGFQMSGVWFKFRQSATSAMPVQKEDAVKVAFSLKSSTYQNQRRLEIHIVHIETLT